MRKILLNKTLFALLSVILANFSNMSHAGSGDYHNLLATHVYPYQEANGGILTPEEIDLNQTSVNYSKKTPSNNDSVYFYVPTEQPNIIRSDFTRAQLSLWSAYPGVSKVTALVFNKLGIQHQAIFRVQKKFRSKWLKMNNGVQRGYGQVKVSFDMKDNPNLEAGDYTTDFMIIGSGWYDTSYRVGIKSVLSFNVEIDSTPPNQPSVSNLPIVTSQDSVVIRLRGEPNTEVWVNQHNSHLLLSALGSINIILDTSATSSSIDFSIRLKDSTGNESRALTFSIAKDVIAPNKPWLTTMPPRVTKENRVVVEVNGEVNSKILVNQVGANIVIPSAGTSNVTLDTSGNSNEKSFSIVLQDRANNQSEKLEFVIKIDRIKPNKPILSVPNYINNNKFNISVRGESGALVKVNGVSSAIVIPENGEITIELDTNNGDRLITQ
ncbi:MAG: hypothetical protein FE834_04680 [Gammaproteobacteria bacterium]|nr:hypothetical protein [Gammaproteobacteria bacterium]